MHFFILKPKTTSVFFSDRPFMRGTIFHKNWQYCTEDTKNDISNAFSIITDKKPLTKTKIAGHLCSRASKICSQSYFWVLTTDF